MRQYEDPKTQAIKYDLYFSDKQIKTGFIQDGNFIPFRHNKLLDKETGENMLLYRISLRDSDHRAFRFNDDRLNNTSCFIQIPAASVTRKIKGLTSVYTVTTAYKDSWVTTVYSGDINSKDGWKGPSEKISLDNLSKCLEFHELEKEMSSPEPEANDIDKFFPKVPLNKDSSQSSVKEEEADLSTPDEKDHSDTQTDRISQLEAIVAAQQKEISELKEQLNVITDLAKNIDVRTESFAERIESISNDHRELIDIYARIKDWSRNMLGKYTNLEYTVDAVRSEVAKIADHLSRSRSMNIEHKHR